jgi:hypothetical protein
MVQSVTRFAIDQLTAARVTCCRCKITTELPIDVLRQAMTDDSRCPHCGIIMIRWDATHPLYALQTAMADLRAAEDSIRVEFVIAESL